MTIAHRWLKVKVMGQANVVGPASIDGSFISSAVGEFKVLSEVK